MIPTVKRPNRKQNGNPHRGNPRGTHAPQRLRGAKRAARDTKLRRAILSGASPPEVAARFGVSVNVVYRACRKGEPGRIAKRQRKEQYRKLAQRVRKGMRCADVARAAGVRLDVVYNACRAHGIKLYKGWGGLSEERRDAIMRKRGGILSSQWKTLDWTLRDVDLSEKLGVSRERVRQKRLELGMPKVSKRRPGSPIRPPSRPRPPKPPWINAIVYPSSLVRGRR